MTYEDLDTNDEFNSDYDDLEITDTSPPEETTNRTFLIVAGVLGALIIVSIVCMALYALVFVPMRETQQATEIAEINAQNTQVALAAAQTEQVSRFTATPSQTPVVPTATTTPTSVVAVPTEVVSSPTPNSRTATVSALLTQAAEAQLTTTPTPSGLPDTGLMDEVIVPGVGNIALVIGVPGLIVISLVLVGVILIARRLRSSD